MKEKKIKTAILCLIGASVVQILSVVYVVLQTLKYKAEVMKINAEYPDLKPDLAAFDLFNVSSIYAVIMLVVTFYVIKDLKDGKAWAWLGGITVFVLSAASFALPFAVVGLISLFDERVRADFIQQLDIKI